MPQKQKKSLKKAKNILKRRKYEKMYKNTFIIKIRAILISYVLGDHL